MNKRQKILIAEDNAAIRQALQAALSKGGEYDCMVVGDGEQAWEIMRDEAAPKLALLDWKMPKVDGIELIRRVRAHPTDHPAYLILLTAMSEKDDIVRGLEAGANDYMVKPYDNNELRARVSVGRRMVELQSALAERLRELQRAFDEIKTLRGIIPICASCKKIRDDQGYWNQVEDYVRERTEALFSHGICPDCARKLYPDLYEEEEGSEGPV